MSDDDDRSDDEIEESWVWNIFKFMLLKAEHNLYKAVVTSFPDCNNSHSIVFRQRNCKDQETQSTCIPFLIESTEYVISMCLVQNLAMIRVSVTNT